MKNILLPEVIHIYVLHIRVLLPASFFSLEVRK